LTPNVDALTVAEVHTANSTVRKAIRPRLANKVFTIRDYTLFN
jgi:hypothetical protein